MGSSARGAKQRKDAVGIVADQLRTGEDVIAVLPFAATPKRPKGPEGKLRYGIYQSYRRYRPLVVTNRRLIVLEAVRTPSPRGVLAEFPLADVGYVDEVPARFGQTRLLLDLPKLGTVPFVLGRFDVQELPTLRKVLEPR